MDSYMNARREHFNLSENPTFGIIMNELGILAGMWHETKDEKYVQWYQVLVRSLLEMGCEDELDLELLLPDRFMPQEWHDRHKVKEEVAP
jgi:hypothetical protein